jgi:hypothetical protein
MLIELAALLFGDQYESAYHQMKQNPEDFKKKYAPFFDKDPQG